MSLVDTSQLGSIGDYAANMPQRVNEGVKMGQEQAIRGALAHLNPEDPTSVTSTLGLLQRMGATDQANAIINLQKTRQQYGEFQKGIGALQGIGGAAQGGPAAQEGQGAPAPADNSAAPPAPRQPTQNASNPQAVAAMRERLVAAQDGVEQLQAIKDPDPVEQSAKRQELYQQKIKPMLEQQGIAPQMLDQWAGQLRDGELASAHNNITSMLDHQAYGGDNDGPHPPLHDNTTAGLQATGWNINSPQVQAALAHLGASGMDTSKLIAGLQAGSGYTGPVGPGNVLAQGGQVTPGTLAPQQMAPATTLVGGGGETIAKAPALKTPEQVAPANNGYGFDPETGQFIGAPTAPAPEGGGRLGTSAGNATLARLKPISEAQVPTGSGIDRALGGHAVITSTVRSAEHNQEVGGVADSAHLDGHAIDFAPPKGVDPHAAAFAVTKAFPGTYAIAEKDHVHVMWAGAQLPNSPRSTAAGQGGSGGAPAPAQGGGAQGVTPQVTGKQLNPNPIDVPGTAGIKAQRNFEGGYNPIPGTGTTPDAVKSGIASNPQYVRATDSLRTFDQLKGQASTMSGPAAATMLAGLAGLSGADPAAIVKQFGLPGEWLGKVEGFGGNGMLTPTMRQQILDAGYKQVRANYDAAAPFVGQGRQIGAKAGADPNLYAPPFPNRPEPHYIVPPDFKTVAPGTVFTTPAGRFRVNSPGSPKPLTRLDANPNG
jgi:hypothetical protein